MLWCGEGCVCDMYVTYTCKKYVCTFVVSRASFSHAMLLIIRYETTVDYTHFFYPGVAYLYYLFIIVR